MGIWNFLFGKSGRGVSEDDDDDDDAKGGVADRPDPDTHENERRWAREKERKGDFILKPPKR